MKLNLWIIFTSGIFAVTAFASEKPIKFSEMPAIVQTTMQKEVQATGAKIKNTLVEVENGKTFYECESLLANGKHRDFLVNDQGKVSEVEEEIEESEIPTAVKATLDKATAGGGKVLRLEAAKKYGKITGYEATIMKNGKKTGLEMNAEGTIMK
jgi:hypothetical protein